MRVKISSVVVPLLLTLGAGMAHGQTTGIPTVSPESVGFSSERLQRLEKTLHHMVETKEVAGMVTLITRHGKIVHFAASGKQDIEAGVPMHKDTIFYMASQTKPLNAVGMMMLYEEGKWRPEDPIARYIPEFANLKVFTGVDKDGKLTVEEPHHAPTMGELMSMSAGFSYANYGETNPIDRLYRDTHVLQSPNLQELVNRIAKIPLLYQPGTRWAYSASGDIQGYLIEKMSGKSIADFYRERLFEPLGMKDSSFQVPKDKLSRLTKIYKYDAAKQSLEPSPMSSPAGTPPNVVSGAGGLYTTAEDYLRFAQMLVNGGELNGAQILAPSSVLLIHSNHLAASVLANGKHGLPMAPNGTVIADNIKNTDAFGIAYFRAQPGQGYGYDGDVIYDPVEIGSTVGVGTYHWGGAFGTWFWVDPTNDVVFVGMIQGLNIQRDVVGLAQALTYAALVDPKK